MSLPRHRHDFDEDGEQFIIYTTLADRETVMKIANTFNVDHREVVEANKPRLGNNLHALSPLEQGTTLVFVPAEWSFLCSICQRGDVDACHGSCILSEPDPEQPLILCDRECTRAYHPRCLGLSTTPRGRWHCQYCPPNARQRDDSGSSSGSGSGSSSGSGSGSSSGSGSGSGDSAVMDRPVLARLGRTKLHLDGRMHSGYSGVHHAPLHPQCTDPSKTYQAYYKKRHLGFFASAVEAAACYAEAHAEDARAVEPENAGTRAEEEEKVEVEAEEEEEEVEVEAEEEEAAAEDEAQAGGEDGETNRGEKDDACAATPPRRKRRHQRPFCRINPGKYAAKKHRHPPAHPQAQAAVYTETPKDMPANADTSSPADTPADAPANAPANVSANVSAVESPATAPPVVSPAAAPTVVGRPVATSAAPVPGSSSAAIATALHPPGAVLHSVEQRLLGSGDHRAGGIVPRCVLLEDLLGLTTNAHVNRSLSARIAAIEAAAAAQGF